MIEKELHDQLIRTGRAFTKGKCMPDVDDIESDQQRRLPQPPLVKAPVTPAETHIALTKDFSGLSIRNDILGILYDRVSNRIYSGEVMSLDQLSFLLWATQGVKGIRGKKYATLRTVPSGGARHPFETYLAVQKVEGLENGMYHYLPMEHALEKLPFDGEVTPDLLSDSMSGQKWAGKANVVFYWSLVPYRAEWRYDVFAHHIIMVDAGHMGQNLYIACTAAGLGTCGVGAFDDTVCHRMFDLDGEEEYIVYSAPVGTVSPKDKTEEDAIYAFVKEEGY